MADDLIYDRGRGPELQRIRITVYDLIPYLEHGHADAQILEWLPITVEELAALKGYIADHYDEVMAKHREIEERIRREMAAQNTPEFQSRFWWNRDRMEQFRAWLDDRRRQSGQHTNGTPPGPKGEEFVALLREFRAWAESRQAAPEGV
jgi:uncharacterized protein (DUF433 family)